MQVINGSLNLLSGFVYKLMIYVCPFCGRQLSRELVDGITACCHCNRVFDSSVFNRLLAAAHVARQNSQIGIEQLKFNAKLSDDEALLVYTFVVENSYSHDEFQRALRSLGVQNKISIPA